MEARHSSAAAAAAAASAAPPAVTLEAAAAAATAAAVAAAVKQSESACLQLPFMTLSTSKDALIRCEMLENNRELSLSFSGKFRVDSEVGVLRRLGLQRCTQAELAQLIPPALHGYVPEDIIEKDTAGAAAAAQPLT
jgi:Transcription factor DP